MQSRNLYYFKKVAELGNITRAAEELYVSQSQLSRIISDVESEVGVPLFDRSKQGIALNASGRAFYTPMLKSLNLYNEAIKRAKETYRNGKGSLIVATNVPCYLRGIAAHLIDAVPDLKVKYQIAPRKSIDSMLRNGSIDLALITPAFDEPIVHEETLFEEHALIVYPSGHELAACTSPVDPARLAQYRHACIRRGFGLREALADQFRSLDLSLDRVTMESEDPSLVALYVERNRNIALLPASFVHADPFCSAHNLAIAVPTAYSIMLVQSEEHDEAPADEVFKHELHAYFARLA